MDVRTRGPSLSRLTKFIAGTCGPIALIAGAIITAAPAQAAGTVCNGGTAWYTITSKTTYDQIDAGDYSVYRAPATASMRVTNNWTATSSKAATSSTTLGASVSVSAGVSI